MDDGQWRAVIPKRRETSGSEPHRHPAFCLGALLSLYREWGGAVGLLS